MLKIILAILFLFSRQSYPAPIGAPMIEPPVLRERYATINLTALRNEYIGLDMFPDAQFIGQTTYTDATTWRGVLVGERYGFFQVAKTSGGYIIYVASESGHYIVYRFGRLYRIVEYD